MADLPPIKFAELADALLGRIEALVELWLPGGEFKGREYFVHSFWRSEKTASLSVCMQGERIGRWSDHGGDHAGNDLISLYAAIHGMSQGQAAVQLARELGLESVAGVQPARGHVAAPRPAPVPAAPAAASNKAHTDEKWSTMAPVPEHAPVATFWHKYRNPEDIEHTATYRIDGALYGYVVRFRKSEGGKETLPYTYCLSERDGACCWKWKTWDDPRPLYFPGGVSPAAAPALVTVVLVEGEKKAGVLQDLLDAGAPGVYLVASWVGGCKAWSKARWHWLQGCNVLLWPDCDGKREPLTNAEKAQCLDDVAADIAAAMKPLLPAAKQVGMKAMLGIGALLRDTHACMVQLLPIPEPLTVVDGWDCADAILTDGWDIDKVLQFFSGAQPLMGSEPAKKIDGLVNTAAGSMPVGTGDTDVRDMVYCGERLVPEWLSCYYDQDKRRWLTSRKMVITALERDPALCDVLGLNELSSNIEARRDWPWQHGKAGPIKGSTDLMLGMYLSQTYGLPSIARAALLEAIETVAHTRPFHPVREYLQGLQWDNKPRLSKWLVHVIGETPQSLKPKVFEYLTQISRFWLIGLVARVMEPGCKFDYCPVLEGPGGLGKSALAKALASRPFFSDAHFDLTRGKEGQEQVQGVWLYELAELAGLGKAEVQLIKAFISMEVDRYRPSYGRTVESFPRQCVMVGTTNEDTYLRDRTGNRRFWPIPVRHRINQDWLLRNRDQLYAEALQAYLAGEAYAPTPDDEARLYVPMQDSRVVETSVLSEMMHLFTRPPAASGIGAVVNELTDFVTLAQVTLALGVDAAKSNTMLEGQVRSWFKQEGWERVKKQVNMARAWGYTRPANWPPIEPTEATDEGMGGAGPSTGNGEHKGADDEPF